MFAASTHQRLLYNTVYDIAAAVVGCVVHGTHNDLSCSCLYAWVRAGLTVL
jgi:hypothetical protein